MTTKTKQLAISSVQILSCVRLFATPWTAAHQASLSITNSRSLPKFMSIESVLPFHTVHGVLKARTLKWFAIPFSRGPRFVRTLHHDLSILDGPTWHGS